MAVCAGMSTIAGRTYAASGASSPSAVAADEHGAAVGLCGGEGGLHVVEAVMVTSGPTSVPLLQRAAHGQAAECGDEPADHLVEARAVDDQPTQAGAALAGGAGGGERDATDDEFHVGAGGDDRRVVAAELEDAAAEATGHHRADLAAHRRAAGGADDGTPSWATNSAPTAPSPSSTWFRWAGTSMPAAAARTGRGWRAR